MTTTDSYMRRLVAGDPVPRTDLFLTNQMNTWLDKGANRTVTATRRLAKVMLDDARGREPGKGRIRSSMIGKCVRAQALSYHGIESGRTIEPSLRALFEAGHFLHYLWQVAGLSARFLTDIEVSGEDTSWGLRGKADGVTSDDAVFELKSVNYRVFTMRKVAPDPQHVDQVHGYMQVLGLDHARIIYQHRDNPGDFIEYHLSKDPQIISRLEGDCHTITSSRPDDMPPPLLECVFRDKGGAWQQCEFLKVCKPEGNADGSAVTFDVNG